MSKSINLELMQSSAFGGRLLGKTNVMILSMASELKSGGRIGVAGPFRGGPKYIIEGLRALGIEAQCEPMIATQPMKVIHNFNSIEGEIIGIEYGEKVQIGFLFYSC